MVISQQSRPARGTRATVLAASITLAAGGLWAAGLVGAAPANAAPKPIVGCGWIQDGDDNRDNTTRCTRPGNSYAVVVEKDCWKFRPPANTTVLVKVGKRWKKSDAVLLVREGASYCNDEYPFMTRVKLPTDGLKPYETRRFRLVQPAVEDRKKTVLSMFVCLQRDGRDKECA